MSMIKIETGNGYTAFDELMMFHIEELVGDNVYFPWDDTYHQLLKIWTKRINGDPAIIINCDTLSELTKVIQFCMHYNIVFSIISDTEFVGDKSADTVLINFSTGNYS